jgi:hypothetical protein
MALVELGRPVGAKVAVCVGVGVDLVPAQKPASLDGERRPVDQCQQILDASAPRCKEARPRLVGVVNATLMDLQRHGVDDEDGFSVLRHLEQSVPA